ncbi:flagellar export protein FliJ [Ferrimonas pelagia]|uniref:Flagellar FliJ protein n=1 Tax=Ferrimonas pelagia TaxID=1177826 RepID=A0ABP9EBU5_9GAMM
MSDPKQLAKVLTLVEQELEQTSLHLRSANSAVAALKQQMQQLQDYRLDYVRQAQQKQGAVLQAGEYQQFHHYIAKLDAAITQHIGKIRQAEQAAQQRQQQWQACHQRQQAIALLINKAQQQQRLRADKALQRDLDEFSLQQFIRRR